MSSASAELPEAPSVGDPKDGSFICGPKLTTVDIMMAFPLEAAQQIGGLSKEKYPLLTDYVKRLQSREAYQSAIKRIIEETGKYDAGI
jgi:glutathione S-transferase